MFLLAVMIMLSGFFILIPSLTYAFDFGIITGIKGPDGATNSLEDNIKTIFNLVIAVSEIAFIIMFLVGGIMYLTAGLSESQGEKARKLILDAVIGIVIVFTAWGVGTWFLTTLKGNSSTTATVTTTT